MLTYNGRLIGPTIRAERVHPQDQADQRAASGGRPPVTVDPRQEDPPHDLYTTNLHTHGLHVSPSGKSDNVFRKLLPGDTFQYEFSIALDHPSGTFWYHPHMHGSVAYQMANGLAGALIVPGGKSNVTVRDLDDIPEIARARRTHSWSSSSWSCAGWAGRRPRRSERRLQ